MRRNIGKMLATIMLASLLMNNLTACSSKETAKEQGNVDTAQNESATVQEQTVSVSPNDVSEVTGVSAKGFTIQKVNGVTYVNGIMIVNKSYPLPQSYNPGELNQTVLDAFDKMKADADAQGLNIWIQSSFRSYEYQETIYNSYVEADGKALADTYSARPGYSEHQSGLCFDLNTIDDSFADTPEGKWVDEHAYEYGFIIRFPKGKENITGYQYESWHLRYVGNEVAKVIHDNNLCLEEYLGVTSQYAE